MSLLHATPEEKIARKEKSFDEFMAKPETKLILSLIPPGDNPDAVRTLLRASFEAGTSCGAADVLGEMLGAMLKSPRDGDRPKF